MLIAVESDRLGSMFTFFLIALVIVAPFGFVRVRAVLRERRGDAPPDTPGVDTVTDTGRVRGDDLSTVIAEIGLAAAQLRSGADESHELIIPAGPTVEGRPAERSVVDALIADAVRRGGLSLEWLDDDDSVPRRLRLTPR